MFKHSKYFMGLLFRAFLKNVSGQTVLNVSIEGTVHKKDGTSERFDPECISPNLDFSPLPAVLPKDSGHEVAYVFDGVTLANLDSVEFTLQRARRLTTKDGSHVSGFISKDEGCFRDYLATIELTGVAVRKKLAELLEYGCGFVIEKPAEASPMNKKAFVVGAKKAFGIQVELMDAEYSLLGIEPPSHPFSSGWVLDAALVHDGVLAPGQEIGVSKESK
jgi:hypothetical protein